MQVGRVFAAIAAVAAGLVACSAEDAAAPQRSEAVVSPCGSIGYGCESVGAGPVAGDGSIQGIGIVNGVDGSAQVRVAFDDARHVQTAVVPRAARIYADAVTSDVALYNLDGRPGREVVVGRGSDGTYTWFGVYAFNGEGLVPMRAPARAHDDSTSMWKLLVGRDQGRVVCNDDGTISVVSTDRGGNDFFACDDALDAGAEFRVAPRL
ncbi:hypothetical protein [Gordonia zhaorongruii]|uniref:hypothetical protein n=1 Tax=Gordonia zhaorongruii TaxID=2597659 RepID=UPI00104C5119|nr:hypothetical protein [Gordonia zhaorongruii]